MWTVGNIRKVFSMSKSLPTTPNLEFDKKQAKALHKAYLAGDPDALERVRAAHPRLENVPDKSIPPEEFKLSDAQLVIAREYGFSSWPKLKHHIETVREGLDKTFQQFATAVQRWNAPEVQALLDATPALASRINDPVIGFDSPAIVIAARSDQPELVDVLIEHGADVNAKSAWWAGAFGTLHNTAPGMVKHLIARGAVVDVHAAAEQGMMDVLSHLIEADPDLVHAKGPDGQRPLHFARSIEVIDYLLEHGADIDARDLDHCGTAAQWLVAEHPDLARHLLERGAQTDIYMACALGDVEFVRKLLDADPNAINKRIGDPDDPLVPPAPGEHIYTYNFGHDQSPFQIARKYGQDAVYQLLMERSPLQRRFVAACERADVETMRAILKDAPDIARTLPESDQRLLITAAAHRHVEGIRLLLEIGFNPAVVAGDGASALHNAAFHGFAEVVKILLQYNAPIDQINGYGGTPLGSAVYGVTHSWRHDGDFPATIEALIQAGSKVESRWIPSGSEAVDEILRRHLDKS
jgi:ankyrin repeat protein